MRIILWRQYSIFQTNDNMGNLAGFSNASDTAIYQIMKSLCLSSEIKCTKLGWFSNVCLFMWLVLLITVKDSSFHCFCTWLVQRHLNIFKSCISAWILKALRHFESPLLSLTLVYVSIIHFHQFMWVCSSAVGSVTTCVYNVLLWPCGHRRQRRRINGNSPTLLRQLDTSCNFAISTHSDLF